MNINCQFFDNAIVQPVRNGIELVDNFCKEKTGCSPKKVVETIGRVALSILKAIGTACLFVLSPGLFFIGFMVGIIFPKSMNKAIERIGHTWEKMNLGCKILAAAGAVLCAPITLPASIVLVAGRLGAKMFKG